MRGRAQALARRALMWIKLSVLVCAGVALMTAACGVRVSAQDFPVLKLSGPEDNARK